MLYLPSQQYPQSFVHLDPKPPTLVTEKFQSKCEYVFFSTIDKKQ